MADDDSEQLRLLSVFHCVLAAIAGLVALFPCIHLVMGILMVQGKFGPQGRDEVPEAMGWIFIVAASVAILLGLSFAVGLLVAARSLKSARRYTFCLVMAGLSCIFVPVGTVLGVFTILVLNRESVKARFRAAAG